MKVQSTKSDISSQATTNQSDASATQDNPSNDFFSDLIASMFAASTAETSADQSSTASDANTQEDQQVDPIFYGINPLLQQQDQLKNANNQVVATDVAIENDEAGTNVQDDKVDLVLKMNQQQRKNISALSDSNATRVSDPTIEFENNVSDKLAEIMPVAVMNTQQTPADKKHRVDSDMDASLQALNSYNMIPADNSVQEKQTQPTFIFPTQNGQTNNLDNQQNKYVDALTQLGNIINSHTAQYANNDKSAFATSKTPQVSYVDVSSKVNQADYGIKIDLLPSALNPLEKGTYNAHIKISPPELGSVMAELRIDKNSADLIILAENNQVKEIIEANLSQLRDSFQQADINLTNIHVDVQTSQSNTKEQQDQNQRAYEPFETNENTNELNKQTLTAKKTTQRLDSIIDTYA